MPLSDLHLLTHDAHLGVIADARARAALQAWLPAWARAAVTEIPESAARIEVIVEPTESAMATVNGGARLFSLGGIQAVEGDRPSSLWLRGQGAESGSGMLSLPERRARLAAPVDADNSLHATTARALYTMLTIASAFLLGRLSRALVHAAAVVDPHGRAWLLVGDSHAGKTSTCATLLQGGWRYTSDDHVVLASGPTGVTVEGWPRDFHLDDGWDARTSTGARQRVDPTHRWPGQWVAFAPLAGLLFPHVVAHEPTELFPVSAADAFARIVRQSPWLLADRDVAPYVMALLTHAAHLPAFALRVGLDCYGVPERLCSIMTRATSPTSTTTSVTPARTAS
jgi:hypothetical protein